MFDLDAKAKQVEFAALVGVTQQAIAKRYQAGFLRDGGTYREWLASYCERLREEAAGRVQSDSRERRDIAAAEESEANAHLKRLELHRQLGNIIAVDHVTTAMADWCALGKSEVLNLVEKIIDAVESQTGQTIDRDVFTDDIAAALRTIGSFNIEPPQSDS